jgi:hypothetical protein
MKPLTFGVTEFLNTVVSRCQELGVARALALNVTQIIAEANPTGLGVTTQYPDIPECSVRPLSIPLSPLINCLSLYIR